MLEWLAAHAATIIISAVLIVLLALSVRYIIKKRRSGGCVGCDACSGKKEGGCSACHGCPPQAKPKHHCSRTDSPKQS